MNLDSLLIGTLCVWRVTHLLHFEHGPWNAVAAFREFAGRSFIGSLVSCFYCLSLWISAPFALWMGSSPKARLLLWLAYSAGSILLERVTSRQDAVPPALYFEHTGDQDVLLRRIGNSVEQGSASGV